MLPELSRGAERLAQIPAHFTAALVLLVLYTVQAEIRFGARARAMRSGLSDRLSTSLLSVAFCVPVLGLVWSMKGRLSTNLPGMPAIAWVGIILGTGGFLLRLWSLLVLRERYTRTLLIQPGQQIERSGPYQVIRHPGYLGSLLCLNGIGVASGNIFVAVACLVSTAAAYSYRIRVEDAMLVRAFGEAYETYRRSTGALLPRLRFARRG